jgi:hypothetical protein
LFSGAVGVLGTAAFGWLTMEQHAAALPTPEFVEKQTQVGS